MADNPVLVDNKAAKAAVVESRKKTHEDIKKARADQEKFNNEKMAREAGYRPTPTVEEIQRAMTGENVDNKEPDGSPEQNPHHMIESAASQIEVGHKMAETKPVDPGPVVASPRSTKVEPTKL
jgi:hypothetical protein